MSKEKPLNVGQQPNPPAFQKIVSETLQGKNLGVDKILLNINSGQSELPTNNNSIIKYSLKQPINLEIGDTITLVSSFVQEKGLAENTISFEEDIEAEMRFLYYKQYDPGDTLIPASVDGVLASDAGYVQYPKQCPDFYTGQTNAYNELELAFIEADDSYGALYSNVVGDCQLNQTASNAVYSGGSDDNLMSGPTGQMGYLMETCIYTPSTPTDKFYRPVYGRKVIKVKAGNYSVDSLANLISAQMNGSVGENFDTFSDALKDKLYFPEKSFNDGDHFWRTMPYFRNIGISKDLTNTEVFGSNPLVSGDDARRVEGFVRQLQFSLASYYNVFRYNQLTVDDAGAAHSGGADGGGRLAVGQIYPNKRFNTDDYTLKDTNGNRSVELATIMTANKLMSNSNAINFYAGALHLHHLFDNDEETFYCSPDITSDNPIYDTNNPNRPPTFVEMMNLQISQKFGIIPFYRSNGAAYTAKYSVPGDFRMVSQSDAMAFNTLHPVHGLSYLATVQAFPPSRNAFAGTSVAELTFSDSQANRFAFQNFHEFYKLGNIAPDGKSPTNYGGQQATKYNNPYYNQSGGSNTYDRGFGFEKSNAIYPIDSSSGIMVNNFDFGLVKNTIVYTELKAKIDALERVDSQGAQMKREKLLWDLLSKPFDQFFQTPQDAKNAWANSLWARLGFSYDQLGDISKNLESTSTYGGAPNSNQLPSQQLPKVTKAGRKTIKNKGIITHNDFDFSKIVSSDGLGGGNPFKESAVPLQNYRLVDYFPGALMTTGNFANEKHPTGNLGIAPNIFHLLSESKPLNASDLPSLSNGKSYLLIESDIIKPNFKDVRANWGNLLGVMSKENATNDTIFGTEPIDFTITEPRLLSDITLYIKNPDGTIASNDVIGDNCGFIIQITKAIKPQALPLVEPP